MDSVSRGDVLADVSMLAFPDPASFLAGQLHHHLKEWKHIADSVSSPLSRNVLDWLENKVQVQPYFRHFKGNFKGEHFDSTSPPQRIFYNHLCNLQSSSPVHLSPSLLLTQFGTPLYWCHFGLGQGGRG